MGAPEDSARIRLYQPVRLMRDGALKPIPLVLPRELRSLASIPGWGLYLAGARGSHGNAYEALTAMLTEKGWNGFMIQAGFEGRIQKEKPKEDAKIVQSLLRDEIVQLGGLRTTAITALAARLGVSVSPESAASDLVRALPAALGAAPAAFPKAKAIMVVLKPSMVSDDGFVRANYALDTSVVRYCLLRNGVKVDFIADQPWPYR